MNFSTSMIRSQVASQTVLLGLPSAKSNLNPLDGLMQALTVSEGNIVTEVQRTASKFEQFMSAMQAKMTALADENRTLREQFVALEGRQRELTVLHAEELVGARAETEAARQEVTTMRREMVAVAQRADERVAAEIAAKIEKIGSDSLTYASNECV